MVTVTRGSAADVLRALDVLDARSRADGEAALLWVYYSGHGDAEQLHLWGSHLSSAELVGRVGRAAARAKVVVLDACRSGAVTRRKGGTVKPAFDVRVLDAPSSAEGTVVLASSAENEDAQESDALEASVFSHFLLSGLIGGADADADGDVTLHEAFEYASERTITTTARSATGAQHPTFKVALGGRGDLVLARPSAASGVAMILLESPGDWVVRSGGLRGSVLAEVRSQSGARTLAVPAGRYGVTLRERDHLREGEVEATLGATATVVKGSLTKVEYGRVVTKGVDAPTEVARRYAEKPSFQLGTSFFASGGSPLIAIAPAVAYDLGWVELGLGVTLIRVPAGGSEAAEVWASPMPRAHVALLPNSGVDLTREVALLFGRLGLVVSVLPASMFIGQFTVDPFAVRITTERVAVTLRSRLEVMGLVVPTGGAAFTVGAGFALEVAVL